MSCCCVMWWARTHDTTRRAAQAQGHKASARRRARQKGGSRSTSKEGWGDSRPLVSPALAPHHTTKGWDEVGEVANADRSTKGVDGGTTMGPSKPSFGAGSTGAVQADPGAGRSPTANQQQGMEMV